MDPRSEEIVGQILNPSPVQSAPTPADGSAPIPLSQIVDPAAPETPYTGPERRAQGYLVADVVDPDTPVRPDPADSPA